MRLQIIQNFVFKFFTLIRLNNETEKEYLISQGTDVNKLLVIPLVVSQKIFKLLNFIDRKDLVYFGNVAPKKNLDTILMALKEVTKTNLGIKLNIIGRIDDYNFILKVKEFGLEKNVIMHGYLAQDERLTNLLNTMLISVNSSKDEGQCVAVYDTALCGCALCLPKIMSFEGVFKNGALFHEVYDYKKLADNILFYLNNSDIAEMHTTKNIEMIINDYSLTMIEEKIKLMLLKIQK